MNEIIKVENGVVVVDEKVAELLDKTTSALDVAQKADKDLRQAILEAMLEAGVVTAKVGNYTLSQVVPKPTVTFNEDAFISEQSVEVLEAFTKIETSETFNVDKFKAENPELYEKYLDKSEVMVVDLKSLQKKLPNVYAKYTTEVKSDKPVTIKIVKKDA